MAGATPPLPGDTLGLQGSSAWFFPCCSPARGAQTRPLLVLVRTHLGSGLVHTQGRLQMTTPRHPTAQVGRPPGLRPLPQPSSGVPPASFLPPAPMSGPSRPCSASRPGPPPPGGWATLWNRAGTRRVQVREGRSGNNTSRHRSHRPGPRAPVSLASPLIQLSLLPCRSFRSHLRRCVAR